MGQSPRRKRFFLGHRVSSIRRRNAVPTEGGEALTLALIDHVHGYATAAIPADVDRWYALWTHSHCEQLVHDQLEGKGFHVFLPKIDVWSKRRGLRHLVQTPMFPGYLFVRHVMDKAAYIDVSKARGLVRVLGERWDRLATVPDAEIEAIQTLNLSGQRLLPYPYLKAGQRVRISGGPLHGVEGTLIETRPKRGLLVVSVHLLQRSVAVVVDFTEVRPL